MKILHIVRQFYPLIGGLENYVFNLAEQQIKDGDEVTVLTLNRSFVNNERLPDSEILGNGVKVIRIPFFFSKKYTIALSAFRYLKSHDLIHVHAVDFFSDYISFTKPFHRKKTILTTHGGFFHTSWAYYFKKIYFHTITRFSLKSYNSVIGCSDNDIEVFKKIVPGIVKIENGVNVQPLLSVSKTPIGHTLLYVGRIDIHKRIDNLIRLISALGERGFETELKVVGPDWKHLLPKLTKLADELKISDKIEFTGPVSEPDLARYYSEAFLFVSASEYEGFGISAIEALASGTPCALNNIRSFRTILRDQPYGILCDFNDIEDTANAVMDYVNKVDPEYTEISNQAREASKKYNWESVARTVTAVYQEC